MKNTKNTAPNNKVHIRFSTKTEKAICELQLADIDEQLVTIHQNKANYDYDEYRYRLVRLYTTRRFYRHKLDKLNKTEK